MKFVKVANSGELTEDTPLRIETGAAAVVLVRVDGKIYAVDDTCTHEEASLAEGFIEGTTIECPATELYSI